MRLVASPGLIEARYDSGDVIETQASAICRMRAGELPARENAGHDLAALATGFSGKTETGLN